MAKNEQRILDAFRKEGLDVTHSGNYWQVRKIDAPSGTPSARVLLPPEFPVEGKALSQLAALAAVSHPSSPHGATRVYASPDFHPGDSGVAIGSVLETPHEFVLPQGVGDDINCGMRLHATDLQVDRFLSEEKKLVDLLRGDLLLGTRNVFMTSQAMMGMFLYGLLGLLEYAKGTSLESSDLRQLTKDLDRCATPKITGSTEWIPESYWRFSDVLRDPDLGTAGGGNHFVEVQVVEEVYDPRIAYTWGFGLLKPGNVVFMIHSGSRHIGKSVGMLWLEKAKKSWPKNLPHPDFYPLIDPREILDYLEAETTASNYASANRMILAEIVKGRLNEIFPGVTAPLVGDIPHNYTQIPEDAYGSYVTRKGACSAANGNIVIIPGSLGTYSYVLQGRGSDGFSSVSHGAGRAKSRLDARRIVDRQLLFGKCITLREERRIEESPEAYKDIQPVIDIQVEEGLVTKVVKLRPLFTFKS